MGETGEGPQGREDSKENTMGRKRPTGIMVLALHMANPVQSPVPQRVPQVLPGAKNPKHRASYVLSTTGCGLNNTSPTI